MEYFKFFLIGLVGNGNDNVVDNKIHWNLVANQLAPGFEVFDKSDSGIEINGSPAD